MSYRARATRPVVMDRRGGYGLSSLATLSGRTGLATPPGGSVAVPLDAVRGRCQAV